MSKCIDEQVLGAYHDGELSLAERAAVEAHLRECSSCSEQLKQLREYSSLLSNYPFAEMKPRELVELHEAVEDAADQPIWRIGGTLGLVAASILVIGMAWLNAIPAGAPTKPDQTVVAQIDKIEVKPSAPWEAVAMTLRPDPVLAQEEDDQTRMADANAEIERLVSHLSNGRVSNKAER